MLQPLVARLRLLRPTAALALAPYSSSSSSSIIMGKHQQRTNKRFRHDSSGGGGPPSNELKQARTKIIDGRRSLDVLVAFEGFRLLVAATSVAPAAAAAEEVEEGEDTAAAAPPAPAAVPSSQLPVDLVTTVLSVFVETPTLPADVALMREHANEIYRTTRQAHAPSSASSKKSQLTEAFYSTTMRVLLRVDDFASALQVCEHMTEAGHSIRHRSYAPLLAKACEMGDLPRARQFYDEMSKLDKMVDDEDATVLLEALAKASTSDASSLAQRVLRDCEQRAMDVPSLRLVTAAAGALRGGQATTYAPLLLEGDKCACCQQPLRSVDASEATVRALIADTAGLAPTLNDQKKREWDAFLKWEQANLGEFDCIVDGANMAYFRSSAPNTDHDEPKYEHADVMMDELVNKLGRRPLLFFHARHFKAGGGGIPQAIVAKWKARTYKVPHGHNDDVFWLHFALQLSLTNPQAWLITNDQMRDHKFEMINTSSAFARWRERHQVAYDFIWDHKNQSFLTGVFPPLPYSVQLQEGSGSASGGKWHFPRQVPATEDELALQRRVEELKKLSQPDLRKELQQKTLTFELYRQVRAEMSGCEMPKTAGKKFEWACV